MSVTQEYPIADSELVKASAEMSAPLREPARHENRHGIHNLSGLSAVTRNFFSHDQKASPGLIIFAPTTVITSSKRAVIAFTLSNPMVIWISTIVGLPAIWLS